MLAPGLDRDSHCDSTARRTALDRLFSRISEVSTLPSVAQRIMAIAQDQDCRASDLRDAIQTDPALVSQLLRRVNSSYYGLRRRVGDLRTAISLLGFREVHNLALTVFVSRWFQTHGEHRSYSRYGLWMHCVGVGLTARLISSVTGIGKPEEVYLAGLLHDLGYILLDQNLRRHFRRVIDQLRPPEPTWIVERRVLTFDHAMLGAAITAKWNFPDRIVDAIGFHHEPERYLGPHREIVYLIAIANYICTAYDWSAMGIQNVPPPPESVYCALNLDDVALSIIQDELPETLARADDLACQ